MIHGCEYPDHLLYDVEAGTWATEKSDVFRLGIAPHLSWISGGFSSVLLKPVGSKVEMGKSLGSAEGPRHFDVVRSPFDSTIRAVNLELVSEPRLANRDPFGKGWCVLLQRTGSGSRLKSLRDAAASIESTIGRLGVHCFKEFPDFEMFEIGVECSAVLVKLNEQLASRPRGTVVHLVSDDPTADVEMARWQTQSGNILTESRNEGKLRHFIVRKG